MENDKKWIYLGYAAATLLLAWVLNQFALLLIQSFHLPNPKILEVVSLSALLSLVVVTAFALFYTRKPEVRSYTAEVCQELRKVTWPSKRTNYLSTVVVVVTVFVMAIVLGLFDWICAKVVNLIVQA